MEIVLLIDYGSTYTKVVAAETSHPKLLGSASAYTTVETDVNEGLEIALRELKKQTGISEYNKRFACSSAAGGLRMVVCGLVPELTAKAASLASMGAGAKVVGKYSYELTEEDLEDITEKAPDILLLTGGTDGGNKKNILHNAEMLANAPGEYPIIVAGNRNSGREVEKILAHRRVHLCENVMPKIDALNIEPAKEKIREIFLERIVHAKGLSGSVLMPTPAAVLSATELLATKTGDLIAIDVGGATTDIYSITDGTSKAANIIYKGLPEPFAKRTVEGDIGMRYSARGIIDAAGISRIAKLAEISEEKVSEHVSRLVKYTEKLPETKEEEKLDFALAAMAIETAMKRHAGSLEEVYTTSGRALIQTGKDLTDVKTIVMTGGVLLNTDRHNELAAHALYNDGEPQSLRPKKVKELVDKHYILAAMGLLSTHSKTAALEIMRSNIL